MTEMARFIAIVIGLLVALQATAALLIWAERRLLALWQDRYGPDRVGPPIPERAVDPAGREKNAP